MDTAGRPVLCAVTHKRISAFNRYAKDFGKDALIECLHINHKNGIAYHKLDDVPGDYDTLETEDEIYELLRDGKCNG